MKRAPQSRYNMTNTEISHIQLGKTLERAKRMLEEKNYTIIEEFKCHIIIQNKKHRYFAYRINRNPMCYIYPQSFYRLFEVKEFIRDKCVNKL